MDTEVNVPAPIAVRPAIEGALLDHGEIVRDHGSVSSRSFTTANSRLVSGSTARLVGFPAERRAAKAILRRLGIDPISGFSPEDDDALGRLGPG
jgi:hypothetical protein